MMTTDDLYEFDLNGYIIYRNFLSTRDIHRALTILKNCHGAKGSGKFSFFELDSFFMELMAHPRTIGILKIMLGDWLRFDHAFGLKMTKKEPIHENLHAGPLQNQRSFWYQWAPGQIMHNGLLKVSYTLNDVHPGDGGFICIPGSHKANIAHRPNHDSHLVINPSMQAGDLLIFTEALVHGSRQWTANCDRTALIYSYAPGCLAWKNYDLVKHNLQFATTELQRDLLRPPFVGNYDEHTLQHTGEWPTDRRSKIRG
ncbi:phytanoyl-CoA dioxygenase PhyH [Edaphobacter aggregans]|uniref:Phytanoyl-CoA dioxygenase PhyH n=1 Tax=Edaphobacter aggregans TaxID=570835 RepID=A0A3R9QKD9_9BACT|nr:phytanoyl-CoA dioxygenase family protein [Edaphobacter aggregans]RSL18643.1 phytanoyl-CoA dioxygenase PhyH [Edaphobacter aggregans]